MDGRDGMGKLQVVVGEEEREKALDVVSGNHEEEVDSHVE